MSKYVKHLANPWAQVGFILVCALWFMIGFAPDILTAILSIAAITFSQMVLNVQFAREQEDHHRDVALHAKIDELIHATNDARDDLVGLEERADAEIERLKPLPSDARPASDL